MGVRAKRGRWPDSIGNYQILNEDGATLLWVGRWIYDPDTEAVAERILAAINGDTVPAPTLPEDVGELVETARDEAKFQREVMCPHGPGCGGCGPIGVARTLDALADVLEALAAAPTLPEGVTPNAQTYTLAADVPSPLGWEWETRDDGWWPCVAEATRFSRIIRPIGGALAAAPTLADDLPSWVSMHATATGADLIEHDPNGDEWERWWANEWWTDHAAAADRRSTYLVRRRPVPVEPTTEKVPLHKVHGRTLAGYSWKVGLIGMDADGLWWAAASADRARLALTIDADGKVTVLVEADR